jgi:hypothetical protein
MDNILATTSLLEDSHMIAVAREIAMDIQPLETILERHGVSAASWEHIRRNPRFAGYLNEAVATWHSALNAPERIKVKSLAAIEDWLLEAYGMLHSGDFTLKDKTELAKLIARLAGVGEKASELQTGEKISITINMGDDTLRAEKINIKTIEHEDKL